MAQTRARLVAHGLRWQEPACLWDVDRPADLTRLRNLVPVRESTQRLGAAWGF